MESIDRRTRRRFVAAMCIKRLAVLGVAVSALGLILIGDLSAKNLLEIATERLNEYSAGTTQRGLMASIAVKKLDAPMGVVNGRPVSSEGVGKDGLRDPDCLAYGVSPESHPPLEAALESSLVEKGYSYVNGAKLSDVPLRAIAVELIWRPEGEEYPYHQGWLHLRLGRVVASGEKKVLRVMYAKQYFLRFRGLWNPASGHVGFLLADGPSCTQSITIGTPPPGARIP